MRLRLLCLSLCAAALLTAAIPARAQGDSVQFFNNIHIPAGSAVHDAVCFFCSVHAEGDVNGDLVVFFGNVRLDSTAHHDVVAFFSSVSATDNAAIAHDFVTFFSDVHLGRNVSVGEDMVAMFSNVHADSPVTIHGSHVSFPFWIFGGPLLILIAVVIIVVRELRARRYRAYAPPHYPFPPQN